MQEFAELAGFVTKNKLKERHLIAKKGGKKSRNLYQSMYDQIVAGTVKTDEDAARLLQMEAGSAAFRVFKSRFRMAMLQMLPLLELGGSSAYDQMKAISICSFNVFAIKLLLNASCRKMAVSLAVHTLSKAMAYELTDVVVYCSRILRSHFSIMGNHAKVRYYNKIHSRYIEMLRLESLAVEYCDLTQAHFATSRSWKPELTDEVVRYREELERMPRELRTYTFNMNYYRVAGISYNLSKDYESSIALWKECLAYIGKQKQFADSSRRAEALVNILLCQLYLGRYTEGHIYADECLKYAREGSINWYTYIEFIFILYMHAREYDRARQILEKATTHPRFVFMDEYRQEVWKIYGAYLHFATGSPVSDAKKGGFKLADFLLETPAYTRDKKGINVSILIFQVMRLLRDQDYEVVQQKLKSLRRYSQLYLSDQNSRRSYLFMQLLFLAEKQKFSRPQVEEASQPLLEKLRSAKMTMQGNISGIEIIPFEHLWAMALQCLPEKAVEE